MRGPTTGLAASCPVLEDRGADLLPLALQVGGFAWLPDANRLGKLVSLTLTAAEVRLRHSSVSVENRAYDPRGLQRAYLSRHTRVYVHNDETDQWIAGRVLNYDLSQFDGEGLGYVVRLPGGDDRFVLERDLEVRSLAPTLDPTDALASGAAESQFLYDRRLGAARALVESRSASAGIDGLVSSSVALLPHQVEIVRRVLDDPLQRYLLADEVGLGKTIEAGAVLRQLFIDASDARAAVVVPEQLVAQWKRELRLKFDLVEGEQVDYYSPAALPELAARAHDYAAVVVDEAHRMISEDGAYPHLRTIAARVRRLILLSATPSLADQGATLALLNLLDPVAYPLEDREAFRAKFELRQQFGALLMALDPEAPSFLLRGTVHAIAALTLNDPVVEDLASSIVDPATTPDARRRDVRSLRHHVSDTYRLHHRLLRTRRIDTDWLERRCHPVTMEVDEDERVPELWSHLEGWREAAYQSVGSDPTEMPASIFATLVEALGRGVDELRAFINERADELAAGLSPCFATESDWIRTCNKLCDTENQAMDHLGMTVEALKLALRVRQGTLETKYVAFASSSALAGALVERLGDVRNIVVRSVLTGMSDDVVEEELRNFAATDRPAVLVVDRSGEEGLNLQAIDGIIHVDLPFDLSRLEQRIGRLDRYGRTRPDIPTRICLASDDDGTPWAAWVEVLDEAFGLFGRSISDVQFLLSDIERDLRGALFQRGAAGLLDLIEPIRERLTAERQRLDEQYALDQLDLQNSAAADFLNRLERSEGRESQFGDAFDDWAFEVLRLIRYRQGTGFVVEWGRDTLAPEHPWRERFEPALGRPLTYRRADALTQGARLIRPGFTLVDEVERLMRRDDRGTAFATWRTDVRWPSVAGEWLGFRLVFVIALDEDRLRGELQRANLEADWGAVRRQADALFPPWIETIELDAALSEVTDPLLQEILRRPYRTPPDINLGSRFELLDTVIEQTQFRQLCHDIRERSEELLRSSAAFTQRHQELQNHALEELELRARRIGRRIEALAQIGERDDALAREGATTGAITAAVEHARIRLEAIGCMVISHGGPTL